MIFVVKSQQSVLGIPVSRNDYAYWAGSSSMVTVDITIDLGCSETKNAWSMLQEVIDTYGHEVQFKVRILPLPYHSASWLLSKAASTVYFYEGDAAAFRLMNNVINNQEDFYNSAIADKDYNELLRLIEPIACNGTNLSATEYYEGMDSSTASGSTVEKFTRYEFKYVILEGFYGTPMYKINGLMMQDLDSVQAWEQALNPLTKTTKRIDSNPGTIYL
jgi:hypothetical protein